MEFLSADLRVLMPEAIVGLGAFVMLAVGIWRGDRAAAIVSALAIGIMGAAAAYIVVSGAPGSRLAFAGSFVSNYFTDFLKVLILAGTAIAIAMSERFNRAERIARFEYAVLIAFSALGMMMMVSANDLITLYVGLELQSLALYVLAAFQRDSLRSTEAGLKYFVLGALSSGLLLYGASLIYGFAGTTGFEAIAHIIGSEPNLGVIVGLVFVLAGLAFKISAVPFHMWTPDVYEGAPTPITAFFAAAPKIAAVGLTLRVLVDPFFGMLAQWQEAVTFIAILSMVLGAFAAIGQQNFKRLMAYSSIANVGHILVGLAAGTAEGVQGVLIYLAIYLTMTLGTFVCILLMRRQGGMVEDISELSGLARTQPTLAFALLILMFSLAGIPPLAGFFGKFYVYLAAVHAGLWPLVIIGILSTVVGAYYYLRIVVIMYDGAAKPAFEPASGEMRVLLGAAAAFNLFFLLYPAPLIAWAGQAAAALFG